MVPIKSTQEIWRFSVKKRAVLRVFAIMSDSDLWAIVVLVKWGLADDDGLAAVAKQGCADGHHALVQREAFGHGDAVADHFAQANVEQAGASAVVDDPVLSKDDKHLYFSFFRDGATTTLRASVRNDVKDNWTFGSPISQPELDPTQTGKLRHPTGISADLLTLFYWDEADGAEHAAFRTAEGNAFTIFVGMGQAAAGQVDATCKRLYYQAGTSFEWSSRL